MNRLLIIRSVPFQQLDLNMRELEKAYPEHEFWLLTHSHGVKLAEKYKRVRQVVTYPYTQGFTYGRQVPELDGQQFDVVVVPVGNLSGAGFFNVLRFSLGLPANRRVMCNIAGTLTEFTVANVYQRWIKQLLFAVLACVGGAVLALPALLLLVWQMSKRGEDHHV